MSRAPWPAGLRASAGRWRSSDAMPPSGRAHGPGPRPRPRKARRVRRRARPNGPRAPRRAAERPRSVPDGEGEAMADQNEQSYPDVYVFFPQAAPDIVQQVQRTSGEGGPVRFVASVTGSFDAIAVVEVEPDREKESPLAALPGTIATY